MTWSTAELARLSGVSSRTLRHYDAIGLLPPAEVAGNGWRYYEHADLLRLQRIMLLRHLGMGLREIARLLSEEPSEHAAAALRAHREQLLAERERLGGLIETVERTIEHIESGGEMSVESLFQGFEANPHEEEARERWGDEAIDASSQRMKSWTPADAEKARTGYDKVHSGLAELLVENAPVTDERVQALVALHFEVTCLFWTPDAAAYTQLGQMYVDDPRFRASIGKGNDALVSFLAEAMAHHAQARLA